MPIRELSAEEGAQLRHIESRPCDRYDVGDESFLAGHLFTCNHNHVRHADVIGEHVFDFADSTR